MKKKTLIKYFQKNKYLLLTDFILLLTAFFYYLFFVNKGIIISDEGYYVHYAERIFQGEIPYRDFVLQYSPGYFYLLAFLYKIFGVQIVVGRFLSLTFCLLILLAIQLLLHLYKITSKKMHVLVALTVIALGYPLLHPPIVVWACVFFTLLLVIFTILWFRAKQIRYLMILGIISAGMILFKQNLGGVFILLVTSVIVFSTKQWPQKKHRAFIFNSVWFIIVGLLLILYYQYAGNFSGILMMFQMSRKFIDTVVFSYPPLTYLFQPTGIFKLLPYYFPIILLGLIIIAIIKKKYMGEKLVFVIFALAGFFTTVYPSSDLLHVYPYLSLVLVSACVFYYKEKLSLYISFLLIIFIFMGVYLTFFTKSFRYEGYFLKETTPLELPKSKGILVDEGRDDRAYIVPIYNYIQQNTKKDDYIFVYPFAPMLYYLLDRKNPTGMVQFVFLEAREEDYPEQRVIDEIKSKKVKYIITVGPYQYDRTLSKFIQQQKIVYVQGSFIIFKVKDK